MRQDELDEEEYPLPSGQTSVLTSGQIIQRAKFDAIEECLDVSAEEKPTVGVIRFTSFCHS